MAERHCAHCGGEIQCEVVWVNPFGEGYPEGSGAKKVIHWRAILGAESDAGDGYVPYHRDCAQELFPGITDQGVPINCPICGALLVYVRAEADTCVYQCPRHGVLVLPPDGRIRPRPL